MFILLFFFLSFSSCLSFILSHTLLFYSHSSHSTRSSSVSLAPLLYLNFLLAAQGQCTKRPFQRSDIFKTDLALRLTIYLCPLGLCNYVSFRSLLFHILFIFCCQFSFLHCSYCLFRMQ